MSGLVEDVVVQRGARSEHVDGAVGHTLTPETVVLQHLLQRHAVGDGEPLHEETLVGTDGLDLLGGAAGLEEAGGPVVQGLVELLDAGVLDLAALLVERVEDGRELLGGCVLGPDRRGDEGVGEDPGRCGLGCVCSACVLLWRYRGVLVVGVGQRGEAIDECSDVAVGRRSSAVEDGCTVWWWRAEQRRRVWNCCCCRWWERDEGEGYRTRWRDSWRWRGRRCRGQRERGRGLCLSSGRPA